MEAHGGAQLIGSPTQTLSEEAALRGRLPQGCSRLPIGPTAPAPAAKRVVSSHAEFRPAAPNDFRPADLPPTSASGTMWSCSCGWASISGQVIAGEIASGPFGYTTIGGLQPRSVGDEGPVGPDLRRGQVHSAAGDVERDRREAGGWNSIRRRSTSRTTTSMTTNPTTRPSSSTTTTSFDPADTE